ncbi:MAG: phosphopyruvate hydratase [Bryobacteraceae bacterium]
MKPLIRSIRALEILDSRGNPTLSVEVEASSGVRAAAQVPSGASTGKHEAVELRDGDPARYSGKGVRRAVENVERVLAPALEGQPVEEQAEIDGAMIALDGSPDKSRLGANALLGISCAVARVAAQSLGVPLWQYLAGNRTPALPLPMVNILSGGLHAGKNLEFQDFLAIPSGMESYSEALEAVVDVHKAARALLIEGGYALTGVADEGGWGPLLPSNEAALRMLTQAIERAGYVPGRDVSIALDVAATHFHCDGRYQLSSESRTLESGELVELLAGWAGRYPVVSIEDGLAEDDWEGWKVLTARLGNRLQLIGDDLFTTNPRRLERGIRDGAANAVLVKMNQIGTLTETFTVLDKALAAGFHAVISARSGETEDSFLADLAVASGAGQIKVGSITRSERLAKYNRLLEIERGGQCAYVSARFRGGLTAISG